MGVTRMISPLYRVPDPGSTMQKIRGTSCSCTRLQASISHRCGRKVKLHTIEILALVLAPLFLLLMILVLTYPNHANLPQLVSLASSVTFLSNASTNITPVDEPEPAFRILIGVITLGYRYEVRHLLRLLRSMQPQTPDVQVNVRFVFCTLIHEDDRVLVALEALRYGDIMILDCKENLNGGKTYTFFSSVARAFNRSKGGKPYYDYVMKTDDDTYIRYPELLEALRPLPRADLYFGHMVPEGQHHKGSPLFMKGMGYVLSWDIVEWIGISEKVRNNTMGSEDTLVGAWLRDEGKGKNMYDTKPSGEQLSEWRHGGDRIIDDKATQYDAPWPPKRFMPRTISVHRLKDHTKWAQALKYFNVTAGFKASPLCNLPLY